MLILSAAANKMNGQVVYDNISFANLNALRTGDPTTLTWSHTVGGTNTYLGVLVNLDSTCCADTITGVTYNGVPMTLESSNAIGTGLVNFYDAVGVAGTHNIVVSTSTDNWNIVAEAASWAGVNQSTPIGTIVFHNARGVDGAYSISTTAVSAVGQLVVDFMDMDDQDPSYNPFLTVDPSQTQRGNHLVQYVTPSPASIALAVSEKAGANSVVMAWTYDGGTFNPDESTDIVVPLVPVITPSTVRYPTFPRNTPTTNSPTPTSTFTPSPTLTATPTHP